MAQTNGVICEPPATPVWPNAGGGGLAGAWRKTGGGGLAGSVTSVQSTPALTCGAYGGARCGRGTGGTEDTSWSGSTAAAMEGAGGGCGAKRDIGGRTCAGAAARHQCFQPLGHGQQRDGDAPIRAAEAGLLQAQRQRRLCANSSSSSSAALQVSAMAACEATRSSP